MKCTLSISSKGCSDWQIECAGQAFDVLGEEEKTITFDSLTPGEYTIKITQKPTEKMSIGQIILLTLMSVIELIFDIFTFSWSLSWKEDVSPYCANAALKVQINNDRKINLGLRDSEYKGGWRLPQITVHNISEENLSAEYSLNTLDFKQSLTHYIVKLSILIVPFSLIMVLAAILLLTESRFLPALFVIIITACFASVYIYQLKKLTGSYKREFEAAKAKIEK